MKLQFRKRNTAFKIASVYFLLSFIWITVSDHIVLFLIGNDLNLLSRLQTSKGIAFIILSSLVVYYLVKVSSEKQFLLNEKLKREKNHYQSLFENVSDAIFLMRDFVFIDCNKQSVKMFGCEKSDLGLIY
jgi:PAS domain-containing protein